ncbi:benzoate/H(+) symporter BenE family transporter [Paraglaciecola aquimarina]|uniref:Benzoate/H(+) symporter BenE family transporter n=1 Tax=Paraglaciecola aquimarina TaxID=1235557 RepID=A0ABU3SWR8_9ALTE|nr:benzoate/H(+) symporter BenE family transporter [Paraglaciecola aquimarina]MDU0354464.1 benzoate/H(+) symporter BenE family transporter [Paraglaciecola aquimarina]
MKNQSFLSDLSLSAVSAGFISVLVGYASTLVIVLQAASASGASTDMLESWVWALGVGMGIGCIGLSLYYKRPIIVAWSTHGAALLITSLTGNSIEQAIGIFVFVGALTLLTGVSGWFDTITKRIPLPLASAMLAGILIQFGFNIFGSMQTEPLMVGIMFITYLVAKRLLPRYSVVAVLIAGFISAYWLDLIKLEHVSWSLATPVWVWPEFDISLLIGVGLPLFIVTITSQTLPGIAILRSTSKEKLPVSSLISWCGGLNILFAPFGAFALGYAAITAALCASEESHPDPQKRYIAGVFCGVFNIVAGVCGSAVVGLFAAFHGAMVAALAGLALLGTISGSLVSAFQAPDYRESALITFLVTASGVSFFNIASAFWGIVIGLIALAASRVNKGMSENKNNG